MPIPLPDPIRTYFESSNARDAEALAAAFSPAGRVRDEGATHVGRAAIAGWASAASARYRMQTTPLASSEEAGVVTVSASVAGDFPGSPIVLNYRFALAPEGIATLEIAS
jgi:hypothetical protein